MPIDTRQLAEMFLCVADLWRQNAVFLSDIDSRFGDGDHGVTIAKIANLITSTVESWDRASMRDLIDDLGSGIMEIGGGSAGPLYGTLIGGFAVPLDNEDELDASLVKNMFAAAMLEMMDITPAKVGDKTMMDAVIPAVEAAETAGMTVEEVLGAAAVAAAAGAKASENFVSKFGRARSYGDKTLGTPDAGALSCALLFQGLHEGFLKNHS